MIVCKLELWPGGLSKDKKILGTITISNDVVTSARTGGRRGSYAYELWKKVKLFKTGRVENYPREAYHPWNLIREILNQVAEDGRGRI